MAKLFSNYAFDYRTINMNILISNQTDFAFYDDVYEVYNGRSYEDVAVFEYYDNGYVYAFFGGDDVKFNSNYTDVTSGTATGFLQQIWNGNAWVPIWGVEDFSYSASALADAILTPARTDDFAVVAKALSGDDTINMSPYGDVVRGHAGDDTIRGNAGSDTLYGDDGADNIVGGSGSDSLFGNGGNDRLTGGAGDDLFVFNTKVGGSNVDTVIGFNHADDTIKLDDDIFARLATGRSHALSAAQYNENSTGKAADADDRIIYNNSTGDLYYDPDGTGSAAAIKFAVINGAPDTVDFTDFAVVT
jgi:Ca2+-binding RTX toxin-like protein